MLVGAGTGTAAYLLTSPAVRQAVGRLVSGVVDVPAAYLSQWAESIRSDTAARKSVISAIAAEAKAVVKTDPELINRGVERWTLQLAGRQETRERIAIETVFLR